METKKLSEEILNRIKDIYTYDVYIAIDRGFELYRTINSDCAPY